MNEAKAWNPQNPQRLEDKWQRIADLIARLIHVPAALIMKAEPPEISVLIASHSEGNPYEPGEKAPLNTGLYCETVMATCDSLLVKNALKEAAWNSNPDIKLGMISYLGYPIIKPDGEIFGTLCVLDRKENAHNALSRQILESFKEVIEDDLRWMEEFARCLREREEQAALDTIHREETRKFQEELDRLFAAIEHSPETIVITDASGTIQYVNAAFESETGYRRSEAIGQNPRILKSGQHSAEFYQKMWDTLTSRLSWRGRLVNRKKDGSFYREEASIAPVLGKDNQITGYVAVKRDISQEVTAESRIRQVQKTDALGRLAKGIAHDFNDILQCMTSYAQLAGVLIEKDHPSQAHLLEIVHNCERAAALIRQILTFGRQKEEEKKPLALQMVAPQALKLVREILPALAIRESIQKDCGAILADRAQIHQMVMNLCMNAWQAMNGQAGAAIEAALEPVRLDSASIERLLPLLVETGCGEPKPGNYTCLRISDTGCGMDRSILEHIFEPYFTTKSEEGASGLGLAVVMGVARNHEALIAVESELGKGTSFSIYFPSISKFDSVHEAAEANGETSALRGNERVMLVDDEERNIRVGKLGLETLGYRVTALSNPLEALAALRAHPGDFDVLVTDVSMPEMTGLCLAEEVYKIIPAMPVILCTGFTEMANAGTALKQGVRRFAMKPLSYRDLAKMIREVIAE